MSKLHVAAYLPQQARSDAYLMKRLEKDWIEQVLQQTRAQGIDDITASVIVAVCYAPKTLEQCANLIEEFEQMRKRVESLVEEMRFAVAQKDTLKLARIHNDLQAALATMRDEETPA